MTILGIRFCKVAKPGEAKDLADMFETAFGFLKRDFGTPPGEFQGAVFPAGEHSWVEIWPEAPGMESGLMLHMVVDDADAYAEKARSAGVDITGPMDAHGERIYFCAAPGGVSMAVLSKLPG